MSDQTNHNKKNLDETVIDWLENEGYPLEFNTCYHFNQGGFQVRQGCYSRDDDSNPREIDLVAQYTTRVDDSTLRVSYFVECKYSKDFPWIVFLSSKQGPLPSATIAQTIGNDVAHALLWCRAGDPNLFQNSLFEQQDNNGFGGVQALSKGKDLMYSAIQSITDATCKELKNKPNRDSVPEDLRYAEIGLPLIVIDGPLYEAWHDSTSGKMKIKRVKSSRLNYQGSAAWKFICNIDVVTIDELPVFLMKRKSDIKDLLNSIAISYKEFKKAISLKSLDPITITNAPRGIVGMPPFLRRLKKHIENEIAKDQPIIPAMSDQTSLPATAPNLSFNSDATSSGHFHHRNAPPR